MAINLKKVSLTVGLAVVFALFVYALIDAFYEEPQYDKYCRMDEPYGRPMPIGKQPPVQVDCPVLVAKEQACYAQQGMVRYSYDNETGCPIDLMCDMCNKEFENARNAYIKNIFYITAPIGLLAIVLGMYLPLTVDAIASGFMFGGIITLVQGTVRVFGDLSKISRVVVLGIELAIIVWLGYRKVQDVPKREKEQRKKKGKQ